MRAPRWLIVAALVLLAYLLYVKRRKVSTSPAVGAVVPPTTAGASTPIVAPPAPAPAPAPRPPASSTPIRDVALEVSDGARDFLEDNSTAPRVAGVGGWMQDAYEQLWLPASRLRLSELTKQDWIYAQQFLSNAGGEFTRRDDLGDVGKALIEQASGDSSAQQFTQIASLVVSIIPVVGALLSKVNSIQGADLGTAAAWDTAMGNGTLGGLMKDAISQDTAQTRHLLTNYSDENSGEAAGLVPSVNDARVLVPPDGPEAPLDRRVMLLPPEVTLTSAQNFSPPLLAFKATDASGQVVTFRMRLRLFTRYQGGWILPWLSWHTNGDPTGLLDATTPYSTRACANRRARIFRAIDALIAGSQPWEREHAPYGYVADLDKSTQGWPVDRAPRGVVGGLHFYVNPLVGPVLGSIFPPTAEDVRYRGTDGRIYSFYGEPMTGLAANAIGPSSDAAIDPVARAAHIVAASNTAIFAPSALPPFGGLSPAAMVALLGASGSSGTYVAPTTVQAVSTAAHRAM